MPCWQEKITVQRVVKDCRNGSADVTSVPVVDGRLESGRFGVNGGIQRYIGVYVQQVFPVVRQQVHQRLDHLETHHENLLPVAVQRLL